MPHRTELEDEFTCVPIEKTMKRFILASVLATFACALSVQAGEPDKACAKAKAACCAELAKAASTASDCCAKETKAKVIAKRAPERGATLLVKR